MKSLQFKPEMIIAYLKGHKTQTRRLKGLDTINANPDAWDLRFIIPSSHVVFEQKYSKQQITCKFPYGHIGDLIYFRETWKMWERDEDGKDFLHYRADDAKVDPTWWAVDDWRAPNPFWFKTDVFEKWQPSMFMPYKCSRFRDVPIINVRIARLNDITSKDALAEGCPPDHFYPVGWYFDLWDKINPNFPTRVNPWVWIYDFPTYGMKFQLSIF